MTIKKNQSSPLSYLTCQKYFSTEIKKTLKKRNLKISPFSQQYLGTLLNKFLFADNYFQSNTNEFPRLFSLLNELQESTSDLERFNKLQHLGDIALFTSGFFEDKIKKNLVDRDYYSAMGSSAYEQAGKVQEKVLKSDRNLNVFFELAASFKSIVDVFEEISLKSKLTNSNDLLKLYQKWQKSPSDSLAQILTEAGLISRHKKVSS